MVALQQPELPGMKRLSAQADPRYTGLCQNDRFRLIEIDRIRLDAQFAGGRHREPPPHDCKQSLKLPRRKMRRRSTAEKQRIHFARLPESAQLTLQRLKVSPD